MTPIYAIDLGTTYTKCAVMRDDGVVHIFNLDCETEDSPQNTLNILRSAVSISSVGGQRVAYVGNRSWTKFVDWNRDEDPPFRRFEESKLWIGERPSDDGDAPPWSFDDWDYRPEDIGALVLRKVKKVVESAGAAPMERIIVTHPQNFSETKREATRQAAAVAGLSVVTTLTEPDAAAIAYRGSDRNGTYMVFDLGGGTLDITIARISPEGTEVLTSEGSRRGGRDWDRVILDRMIDFYRERFPEFNREVMDDWTRQDWYRKAERLKWQLSDPSIGPEHERGVGIICQNDIFNGGMKTQFRLKHREFEAMTQGLLDDCERCANEALAHKNLSWQALDGVLLVGGSTKLSAIREMLTRLLGKPLDTSIDPSVAVVRGAAQYAQDLDKRGSESITTLIEAQRRQVLKAHTGALARGLGVKVWDPQQKRDYIENLIPKDSRLPTSHQARYVTSMENQEILEVELWEGESRDLEVCDRIGSCVLTGIKPGPAGQPVDVTIRVDPDGSKHVLVATAGKQKEEVILFDEERVLSRDLLKERRNFIQTIDIQ